MTLSALPIQNIEMVLTKYVRPSLANHQGNVVIVSYADGILRVRLTGKCSGCPSAQLTTEEIIAQTVKEHLPQIQDVVLVSGVSDDLIAQAKALLHHRHN
ncbi:NifU family protein [uncultured Megasphaera sp.]|uniref:NifU family protein n=1 Tax=uncultured Megasphaera sp. TaxID=165188 RepID=UPI00265A04D6|nr:NifU family protein [uncultured Megasphaera sp.]